MGLAGEAQKCLVARDTLNAALATVRLGAACEETALGRYPTSPTVICLARHRQGFLMTLAVTRLGRSQAIRRPEPLGYQRRT